MEMPRQRKIYVAYNKQGEFIGVYSDYMHIGNPATPRPIVDSEGRVGQEPVSTFVYKGNYVVEL